MPLRSRAGLALMDLMVSLVLTGLLGIVLVRASLTAGRMARAELAANALQVAFDGGLGFLAAELAQTGRGADGEDLLRIAPDSLRWIAPDRRRLRWHDRQSGAPRRCASIPKLDARGLEA